MKSPEEVPIRFAGPGDLALVRQVRLRALRDSPDAFGNTAEEEQVRPDDWWVDVLRAVSSARREREPPATQALLVAVDGDRAIGMAGAFVPEPHEAAHIWGMWVDPARRGEGLGRRFLDALVTWARDAAGVDHVHLDVVEGNAAAVRLYESFGFVRTGNSQPLREGSDLVAIELERDAGLPFEPS